MSQPEYLRPATLDEALGLLDELGERARLLAGGTDLLVAMRRGAIAPEAILDITLLDELRGIRLENDLVTIGALVTHGQVRFSEELAAWAPLLVRACREVGSPQIRSRGTLGGNLGNASPAGDTLPALYALGAEIGLVSLGGQRWVPVDQFFVGPGRTCRGPAELITAVRFCPLAPGERSFFLKIGQRRAMRVSKVSAAGTVLLAGGVVERCRLALGAVAPTVIRLPQAEALLADAPLTIATIGQAAALAGQLCAPIDDIRSTRGYRRTLAGVLVQRGLTMILEDVKPW